LFNALDFFLQKDLLYKSGFDSNFKSARFSSFFLIQVTFTPPKTIRSFSENRFCLSARKAFPPILKASHSRRARTAFRKLLEKRATKRNNKALMTR
jgi:hypothetical protein